MADTKAQAKKKAEELGLTVVRLDGKKGDPDLYDYQHAIGVAEGALLPMDPVEAAPVEKTYLVTGTQEVEGAAPGTLFTKALPAEQEERLLVGGAVTIVERDDEDTEEGSEVDG